MKHCYINLYLKKIIIALSFILALTFPSFAEKPVDYFNSGNSIKFCSKKFYLSWSAHPQRNYYIQEYLPKGDSLEHFNEMFTINIVFWNKTLLEAVQSKIAELEKRKETDKLCNYIIAEKDGEYILDFIVSDGKNGELDVVEANIHHYKQATIDNKKATILSFYSARAYDDAILPFIKSIPNNRNKWYNQISKLNITPKFYK